MTEPKPPDELQTPPPAVAGSPAPPQPDEESPFEPAIRAGKTFLWTFLASWALVYVSGPLKLEWLYFVGLTGVGLAMMRFLVWLIRGR